MKRTLTRILFAASLGLGLSWSPAQATHPLHRPQPHCPPTIVIPYTPTEQRPSDLPPSERPATPDAAPPAASDLGAPSADSGAGNVPMVGRGDQNQRFNLFDHMSAIPTSRAWFGFQYLNDYGTGLSFTSSFQSYLSSFLPSDQDAILSANGISRDVTTDRKNFLYRAGFECALSECCSIAAQWEYFTVNGEAVEDGFNNPQIMGKYLLYQADGCAMAVTLGFEPETKIDRFQFKENHSRIYPGVLYYSESGDCILQGGAQFGLPLKEDQIKTFDWAISLGYWLYRNPSCGGETHFYGAHTCGQGCCNGAGHGGILGVIPQIEIMGKHVIGNATSFNVFDVPFFVDGGLFGGDYSGNVFVYEEPRNVIDLTVGATILLNNNVSIASGVSFPLTKDDTRTFEYIFYVNYGF